MTKLKIDFGSGYNAKEEYKTCDITYLPNLDYVYDEDNNKILYLEENSVDEFYLRNVIHHMKDMEKEFSCLKRYLKTGGIIRIIDVRKEYFKQNYFLDNLWYRFVIPREEIWFSSEYRNYFDILEKMGFKRESLEYNEEKEESIWRKLSNN